MPTKIHPRKLAGPWSIGFALDFHTSGSTFIGYNSFGHPEFDTQRPPMCDLLYRLKNRGDLTAIEPIGETAALFLQSWHIVVDAIIPVPPSNTARNRQPVIEVVTGISKRTGIPLCTSCVSKVKNTGQLKDIFDRAVRDEILADAFVADRAQTEGRRIQVFDDLYRSGATAAAITHLRNSWHWRQIFVRRCFAGSSDLTSRCRWMRIGSFHQFNWCRPGVCYL